MLLGCIADDFTGASDLANTLAKQGITPYVVMRVGRVPVLKYTKPGSADIVPVIRERAKDCSAVLLGNHGPVGGTSLEGAVFAAEELEETAKLILLTRGMPVRTLASAAIADLENSFRLR